MHQAQPKVGLFAFECHIPYDPPTMTVHPTRHRIKFSELALGQRFYDPISAEYFVKQSETMAAMVTGIGDGTIPDEFEPDDIVGIDA